MSMFDALCEGISAILEVAKDLPTEKIAAAGLILLGTAAIARDIAMGSNPGEALDKVQDLLGR